MRRFHLHHDFWMFVVAMAIKFMVVHYMLYKEILVWHFMLGDLAALLFAAIGIELLRPKRKTAWYQLANFSMTSFLLVIILYHDYYGAIVTPDALKQFDQVGQISDSIFSLLHFPYLLLYLDIVICGFLIFRQAHRGRCVKSNRVPLAVILLVLLAGCAANIQANSEIINERKQSEKMGLIGYQAFQVVQNLLHDDSIEVTEAVIEEWKKASRPNARKYFGVAQQYNVVAVQLEAFQNFPVQATVDGKAVTPVLNQLVRESVYFPRIFQQIGKGNTSDAEFLLNTSLYPLGNIPMSQFYQGKEIPSFPRLLAEKGYQTATFHTNDVSFWDRDKLYQTLGFQNYYDQQFFGTEDKIAFGASDEVLYQKAVEEMVKMSQSGQPFYAHLIAMSSHHPFHIPDSKQTLNLPAKYQDTAAGDYLEAVHYADFALGTLVEGLKENGLWEKTVLVVYGDHYGLSLTTPEDEELIRQILGRDYDPVVDKFNIPLLIRVPHQLQGMVVEEVGGQIDLMPTIANLLGISLADYVHFGQDLLNEPNHLLGIRFYLPTGSFVANDLFYVPGEYFEEGEVIPLTDQEIVLAEYRDEYEKIVQILEASDAYQYYLLKVCGDAAVPVSCTGPADAKEFGKADVDGGIEVER